MKLGRACVSRGFGMMVCVLSPLASIGTLLLAIAVAHDFFYFSGDTPIALGLSAPAGYLLLRWAVPRVKARVADAFGGESLPAE